MSKVSQTTVRKENKRLQPRALLTGDLSNRRFIFYLYVQRLACLTTDSHSGSFSDLHPLKEAVASFNSMSCWGSPGHLTSLSSLRQSICRWKLGFPECSWGKASGGDSQGSGGIIHGRGWRKHLVLGGDQWVMRFSLFESNYEIFLLKTT